MNICKQSTPRSMKYPQNILVHMLYEQQIKAAQWNHEQRSVLKVNFIFISSIILYFAATSDPNVKNAHKMARFTQRLNDIYTVLSDGEPVILSCKVTGEQPIQVCQ